MAWFNRPKAEAPKQRPGRSVDNLRSFSLGKKESPFSFSFKPEVDIDRAREQARKVRRESLIAKGLLRRLTDNVINTGLTWESSPLWDMIPDAPENDEARQKFTTNAENYWKLYAGSTEADIKGKFTFRQLQRQIFQMGEAEGEVFLILRYISDPNRISNVAIQKIENDQVATDYDTDYVSEVNARGGWLDKGIEYDSTGREVAVWLRESLGDDPVRIPYFGNSGRRFVIHYSHNSFNMSHGLSSLCNMVYELAKLAEYDENELEATVANALWMGVIEADKDVKSRKSGANFRPAGVSPSPTHEEPAYTPGVDSVKIDGKALIMNTLNPGWSFKGFQPTRPNQNYEKFVEAFETRICGYFGMPLSVYKQKFQSSYSAARTEILFFWNSVMVYRDDMISGFLAPYHEAVFSEWVKAGVLKCPGFGTPIISKAWLYGSWTGISRPVVDPVKEANAVEKRLKLGHTTGEREAKTHNGSDFAENINRLSFENPKLAEVNKHLDPAQYSAPDDEDDSDNDQEEE
ncbi:MAG: phage portal protein [Spirochaetales bacterium]|nr:phage portal protein [Spirochaetales bacterium]